MFLLTIPGNKKVLVKVRIVEDADFKVISAKRFSFNWKKERGKQLYKIVAGIEEEILGLMSLVIFDDEQRIEISLLAVAKEQIGGQKSLDRIAGNLIAYAGRLAITRYGAYGAISLVPKTRLIEHYIKKYGFEIAGKSLLLDGDELMALLKLYDHD